MKLAADSATLRGTGIPFTRDASSIMARHVAESAHDGLYVLGPTSATADRVGKAVEGDWRARAGSGMIEG
ncbi:hypothetical protein [Marinivivus vitaminiproducens]|uniref:hypothetical protein n=1 Tax=Marinivivus vitaminiproducens TaxID=3035935 RepID=UPI00279D1DF3|nr:hypothetical protein P4R82_05545 [Geminicoccaceae bacterium SCSIO 64248]